MALTLISGGTMFGNWAMGRSDMATRPTITMRIEITMATMGRLMKNRDMAAYLFSARMAGGAAAGGGGSESAFPAGFAAGASPAPAGPAVGAGA